MSSDPNIVSATGNLGSLKDLVGAFASGMGAQNPGRKVDQVFMLATWSGDDDKCSSRFCIIPHTPDAQRLVDGILTAVAGMAEKYGCEIPYAVEEVRDEDDYGADDLYIS